MTRQNFLSYFKRGFDFPSSLRVSGGCLSLVLTGAMAVASNDIFAQITQGSGSSQQENRTSAMGSSPDPAASMVHESNKPQSKDSGSGNSRGKTGAKGHKAQGAGGFDNGLYGTGAGTNK
jgi:hypothetical protein